MPGIRHHNQLHDVIEMHAFKWPPTPWPKDPKYKELGIWNNEHFCNGFEAFTMAPLTKVGHIIGPRRRFTCFSLTCENI
ncbi:methyltransferase domain-containing protein [Colletotrichum costaricense]|uniref:Methyltransferase domain-containing protein n=2 Tax=Colletotrichum acutatum species complex TaxID=2707335 RepID=A0AAI9YTE6_9PEZI|nr:methyltransferase domain-containing protein [Colletotrichum costaricense]XP_060376168.1 methyltransferase domain-containing protein [Colletotrichum tamarilloi]KAK1483852.1 methyltransferase domain-containing protein [Colletotrichum tamarilloi]KAK1522530.1 methyltransferase domain-containing protein [Colletotrichum costaricense]